MSRMVHCAKLGRELPALPFKPFDNELGQRLYDQVSMEAWRMWLEHSKMIINEYRLDLTQPQAHDILLQQCEQFFFGEGAALPPDYVAPQAK
ncbi:oxidative damage protection protein [Haliangium sp.]|uniref:oxidative damage protection protein n=1 Tax=Haliangium sp. TaxID=2663208 RepID=UPI003D0B79A1